MTTEEMLKAIIKAQVKGGCEKYKHSLSYETHLMGEGINKNYMCDKVYAKAYILEILLDTDGLKAAYGDYPSNTGSGFFTDGDFRIEKVIPQGITNAHGILNAWLIEGTEAAIKTAYDLLP